MPYELYKVIHVFSLVVFVFSLSTALISNNTQKWAGILMGITSLLLFIAGMGLIARIGIGHGEPWPLWLKAKVGLWLALAIGSPVMLKRMLSQKVLIGILCLLIILTAIIFAVYKF